MKYTSITVFLLKVCLGV